jgi:hypothetical protein
MGHMTVIDGSTLEGVSARTLWTLHDRGTEAKRCDGGVRVARDVPLAPGRGPWRLMSWKPLDCIAFVRRNRPPITLLEFQ